MQRGFVPLLVLVGIVMLVAVAGGAYFFGKSQVSKLQTQSQVVVSPTPQLTTNASSAPTGVEESADWKTYTNIKYDYSIKYPYDWENINYTGGTIPPLPVDDKIDRLFKSKYSNDFSGISLSVGPVNNYTLDSLTNTYAKASWDNINVADNSVDGVKAKKITGELFSKKQEVIIFIKENNAYIIKTFNDHANILDKMLSTFKFLDQSNNADKPVTRKAPSLQTPTAGICIGPLVDEIVKITRGVDNVPVPRCIKVTTNQKLEIVNNSNQTLKGDLGVNDLNIKAGQSQIIDISFGQYLLPGVHSFLGAEIWLQ